MIILFHKMRTGKRGQIASVLTLTLIIFVIAAFLVVNLGKNKVQDNRIKNAAQAGVLAGGSSACIILNSMANLNDSMVLNFAGFTLMIQFMLISWTVDYVKTIIAATSTLTPFNTAAGLNTVLAVATLCITTATLALLIEGATKLGNAIYKMIEEMNEKLPKNSRDSARQYAFSNAGVDEPKIPFSKSGCSDAWCYSLLETKFDEFMRLMPTKNKNDKNYNTSTMEFDWDDSRTGHIVNNKVSVVVTPVKEVSYTLMKYGDVASESGAINSYLSTQSLGWLKTLITLGVSLSSVIIALIWATEVLIVALAVVLGVLAYVEYALAAVFYAICYSCSWYFCACCWACPYGAYYTTSAGWLTAATVVAAAASVAFLALYIAYPPEDIPCFVWDKNNTSNSYPLEVEVTRTTNPESINYGIYTTDWPSITQSASGNVKDGSIFPPSQLFDIIPDF